MNRFQSGDGPSFRKPWERGGESRPSFGSKPAFRKSGFKKPWERAGEDRPRRGGEKHPPEEETQDEQSGLIEATGHGGGSS